jgi:alpha-beta hydrolase superfamily lysophospholipase
MPVPTFPSTSEARHEEGFLHARDNLRLYWQRYTPPTPLATVAVAPGGGDHSGRYPGLTAALVRAGFEVELLDFRGHGQSDGRRWHIDAFSDYVGDLDVFMAHVRAGADGRRVFLVGHSQGGLIATSWALAGRREISGVVLSSPFFRLAHEPPRLKVLGGRLAGAIVPWLPIATGLRMEDLTADEDMRRWTDADPLYGRTTTPRWFDEAMRAQREILPRAPTFSHPLLVLVGEADQIADPASARAFFDAAASPDKAFASYPGFRHELFNERDAERPIAETVTWLRQRAG